MFSFIERIAREWERVRTNEPAHRSAKILRAVRDKLCQTCLTFRPLQLSHVVPRIEASPSACKMRRELVGSLSVYHSSLNREEGARWRFSVSWKLIWLMIVYYRLKMYVCDFFGSGKTDMINASCWRRSILLESFNWT